MYNSLIFFFPEVPAAAHAAPRAAIHMASEHTPGF